MNEKDRYGNRPLYVVLTSFLREHDIQWVTVTRGRTGSNKQGETNWVKFCPMTSNAPIILDCIDESAKIEGILPEIDKMVQGRVCVLISGDIWN